MMSRYGPKGGLKGLFWAFLAINGQQEWEGLY